MANTQPTPPPFRIPHQVWLSMGLVPKLTINNETYYDTKNMFPKHNLGRDVARYCDPNDYYKSKKRYYLNSRCVLCLAFGKRITQVTDYVYQGLGIPLPTPVSEIREPQPYVPTKEEREVVTLNNQRRRNRVNSAPSSSKPPVKPAQPVANRAPMVTSSIPNTAPERLFAQPAAGSTLKAPLNPLSTSMPSSLLSFSPPSLSKPIRSPTSDDVPRSPMAIVDTTASGGERKLQRPEFYTGQGPSGFDRFSQGQGPPAHRVVRNISPLAPPVPSGILFDPEFNSINSTGWGDDFSHLTMSNDLLRSNESEDARDHAKNINNVNVKMEPIAPVPSRKIAHASQFAPVEYRDLATPSPNIQHKRFHSPEPEVSTDGIRQFKAMRI